MNSHIFCIELFLFFFFFLLNTDFNKVKSILKKGFLFIYIDKTILTCCTWPCLWLNHLNLFCTNIIYQKLVVTNLIYFFYSRLIQLRHLYKLKKMIIKNLYFQIPYWPIMKCMFIAVYQCFVVLFYVCW